MAPPRKKPLPPGTKPPLRKPSISSTTGAPKHSSGRSASKSSAAAAAAATALAAGTSSSGRSKTKPKVSRHVVDQPNLPALERMDNGMRFSSFPVVLNINQKNYYTDYLKKDEQVYIFYLRFVGAYL
jgi:actin-related protein 8